MTKIEKELEKDLNQIAGVYNNLATDHSSYYQKALEKHQKQLRKSKYLWISSVVVLGLSLGLLVSSYLF